MLSCQHLFYCSKSRAGSLAPTLARAPLPRRSAPRDTLSLLIFECLVAPLPARRFCLYVQSNKKLTRFFSPTRSKPRQFLLQLVHIGRIFHDFTKVSLSIDNKSHHFFKLSSVLTENAKYFLQRIILLNEFKLIQKKFR